jgi:Tn3 transposase DDE domain
MLSNVADTTEALASMAADGQPVTKSLVAYLSPYMREHIRRFGQYVLDMDDLPSPSTPSRSRSKSPCDHFLHVS